MGKTNQNFYKPNISVSDQRNSTSIQPMIAGEIITNSAVNGRPIENLRYRSDLIKDTLSENLKLFNSDRKLEMGMYMAGAGSLALGWNSTTGMLTFIDDLVTFNVASHHADYINVFPMLTTLGMQGVVGASLNTVRADHMYPVIYVGLALPPAAGIFNIVVGQPISLGGDKWSFELVYSSLDGTFAPIITVSVEDGGIAGYKNNIVVNVTVDSAGTLPTVDDIVAAINANADVIAANVVAYQTVPPLTNWTYGAVARVYATSGVDGEVHRIPGDFLATHMGVAANALDCDYSILAMYYDVNVDPPTEVIFNGRLQSYPGNRANIITPPGDIPSATTDEVSGLMLFTVNGTAYTTPAEASAAWVNFGRKYPNAIPIAIRLPGGYLKLLNGTVFSPNTYITNICISTDTTATTTAVTAGWSGPTLPDENGGLLNTSTTVQQALDDADLKLRERRVFTAVCTDGAASLGGLIDEGGALSGDVFNTIMGATWDGRGMFMLRRGAYELDGSMTAAEDLSLYGETDVTVKVTNDVNFSTVDGIYMEKIEFLNTSGATLNWAFSSTTAGAEIIFYRCKFNNITFSAIAGHNLSKVLFINCTFNYSYYLKDDGFSFKLDSQNFLFKTYQCEFTGTTGGESVAVKSLFKISATAPTTGIYYGKVRITNNIFNLTHYVADLTDTRMRWFNITDTEDLDITDNYFYKYFTSHVNAVDYDGSIIGNIKYLNMERNNIDSLYYIVEAATVAIGAPRYAFYIRYVENFIHKNSSYALTIATNPTSEYTGLDSIFYLQGIRNFVDEDIDFIDHHIGVGTQDFYFGSLYMYWYYYDTATEYVPSYTRGTFGNKSHLHHRVKYYRKKYGGDLQREHTLNPNLTINAGHPYIHVYDEDLANTLVGTGASTKPLYAPLILTIITEVSSWSASDIECFMNTTYDNNFFDISTSHSCAISYWIRTCEAGAASMKTIRLYGIKFKDNEYTGPVFDDTIISSTPGMAAVSFIYGLHTDEVNAGLGVRLALKDLSFENEIVRGHTVGVWYGYNTDCDATGVSGDDVAVYTNHPQINTNCKFIIEKVKYSNCTYEGAEPSNLCNLPIDRSYGLVAVGYEPTAGHKVWTSWDAAALTTKRISALSGEAHRCNLYCSSAAEIVNVAGPEPYWHLPYVRDEYPFATFNGPYATNDAGGDPYNTFRHDPEYNSFVPDILGIKGEGVATYGFTPSNILNVEELYSSFFNVSFGQDDGADNYAWKGLLPLPQLHIGKRPYDIRFSYIIVNATAPVITITYSMMGRYTDVAPVVIATDSSAAVSGIVGLTLDPRDLPYEGYFYFLKIEIAIHSTTDPYVELFDPKVTYIENENYHNYMVL